jgi:MHS family proline/betaine transporter-like MFS transporter
VLLTYPAFQLMQQSSPPAALTAQMALGVLLAGYLGALLVALTELFATRVRYSGFSIGYNFSVALFGGTGPFLVTYLIAQTGDKLVPAYYLIAGALVSLLFVAITRETAPMTVGRG